MKLFRFLLATLLAINVLAVVPFYERRGVEMPPGAHWEGNTLVLPNDYDTDAKDEDNIDHFEHGIQARTVDNQTNQFSNMTATTQSGLNWGTDSYAVDIRVSNDSWAHVGTLRKYRLWKAVYDCLKIIAEPRHGTLERCSAEQSACTFTCKVPNGIVYEDGPENYATQDAYIRIRDDWSELIESKHPGIRNLAYKFIADIWRLHSENEGNCHEVDFEGSRRTTLCNVPRNLLVVWPARGDEAVQARVNLWLDTHKAVASANFFCQGPMAAINSHFSDNVLPKMSKVIGWPSDKIRLFNSCQKKECFDVKSGGYFDQKPWQENKNCDPPFNPVNL